MSSKGFTLREKQEVMGHYDRMIAWARTQASNDQPSKRAMIEALHESWLGDNCYLCDHYNPDPSGDCCEACPMRAIGGICGEHHSLWAKMNRSTNWSIWIERATALYDAVEHGPFRPPLGIFYAVRAAIFGPYPVTTTSKTR